MFLIMQTWAIAYLVLHYGGQPGAAVGYSAVFAVILSFLMSPAAPASLLVFLQSSVMVNIGAARVSNITIFLPISHHHKIRVNCVSDGTPSHI